MARIAGLAGLSVWCRKHIYLMCFLCLLCVTVLAGLAGFAGLRRKHARRHTNLQRLQLFVMFAYNSECCVGLLGGHKHTNNYTISPQHTPQQQINTRQHMAKQDDTRQLYL